MKEFWDKIPGLAWRLFGPKNLKSESEIRVARVLCVVLPSIILGNAVVAPILFAVGQTRSGLALLVGAGLGLVVLLIVKRGISRIFVFSMLLSPLALGAYLLFNQGGIHDISIIIFPGLIVLASLLMRKRYLALYTLITIATIATIAYLEINGIAHTTFSSETTWDDVASIAVMLIVTAVLARLMIDDMQASINQAKRSEKALAASEAHYRALVETSPDGIVVIDPAGVIVSCNRRVAELFGYEQPGELLGINAFSLIAPEDLAKARKNLEVALRQKKTTAVEFRFLKKDGSYFAADITSSLTLDEAENPTSFIIIIRDISERKAAEQERKESEERFRLLAEAAFEGIGIADQEGKIMALNNQLARMLGYAPDEMIGMKTIAFVAPQDLEHAWQRIDKDIEEPFEHMALRKDGSVFPVEERTRPIPYKGGKAWVTTLIDLSEKRRGEEERRMLEAQVQHAQKMDSLGTLAGGIAHDFNNIISIIIGHASTMPAVLADRDQAQQKLQRIIDTADRGASLVKQIMTFAQKTTADLQMVDVNRIIEDLVEMLRVTFPKTIEIVTACDPDLPRVLIDPNQLHQALLNLCINARDAMSGFGKLTLATAFMAGEKIAKRFPLAAGTRYVQLRIEDTGVGMSEEVKKRIFEPFFTTKGHGKGTGLGLAVVFGVVRGHDGFIEVTSQPGTGASFALYFPISEGGVAIQAQTVALPAHVPRGSETLLVIEDEESLLDLMVLTLEGAGYTVMKARDGAEAIQSFRQNWRKIDLVLTDMDLPRINGAGVSQMILAANEKARIILFSGYMDSSLKSELLRRGVRRFMQKPYNLDSLLRTVRSVLDE